MTAITSNASLHLRRRLSEPNHSKAEEPVAQAKKLRVIQLGSYPASNRGARANLLTIHERLQTRGSESALIDLTGYRRVKQPGVYFPYSTYELLRLIRKKRADVVHLHIGSALTFGKLALAAMVSRLPDAKKVLTLHLGGHFFPSKGERARRWGWTGWILRRFDTLIAINPEGASFFESMGVPAERIQLITPFPRLRVAASITLSDELEVFCRQHTPLIASVGEFEPGSDLAMQFDLLSKVRERYPSAGLIAMGDGSQRFKYLYEQGMHQDSNHIALPGLLPGATAREVISRANVLLRTAENGGDSLAHESFNTGTPIVSLDGGVRSVGLGEVEIAALRVLRSLQVTRLPHEDAPAALSDGADDLIRLYKQLTSASPGAAPLPAGYEWPSVGWGL
jgi:glycosyltransferase involved in cell wall biosynthesis